MCERYCSSPEVVSRIIEYCGGTGGDASSCTARYLVADGKTTTGLGIPRPADIVPAALLASSLAKGLDVFRSVWDSVSLVAILDIDYLNPDLPGEALSDAPRAFGLMEAVYQDICRELDQLGINFISLMTGQGYHFAWRISDKDPLSGALRTLAETQPTLEAKYEFDHPFTEDAVGLHKGQAHTGFGVLMECLTHRILRRAYPSSPLPIVVNGLAVGSQRRGREAMSIDLSAYADPVFMRYTRCAFSIYRKPGFERPMLISLPRRGMDLQQMLEVRGSPDLSLEYASSISAAVPESSVGTARLLEEYEPSDLRKSHLYFESERYDGPGEWHQRYDRLNLDSLPPCVSFPLRSPNPNLANPTNMLNVTRVLLSKGWHPRWVVGLLRSKFERNYHWGVNWLYYDAAARADTYVRIFHGLMSDNLDDLRDFNCVSHQEKGYCPKPWCGFSLGDFKQGLERALC